MAKGTVKGIPTTTPTPVKTVITTEYDTTKNTDTTSYDATTPVGNSVKGQITDSQTGADINFVQSLGMEIGLENGVKVSYNVVTVNGAQIANCVKLLERGVIQTINATNDGGTLLDKATKKVIPFAQEYCAESGFVAPSQGIPGSLVSFERIINPKTASYVAVCLELKNKFFD